MSALVVVYEPEPTHASAGGGAAVVRVHAAPAAPGTTDRPGPRTLCGKDTFAMTPSPHRPSTTPGEAWYPERYAGLACPACDDAVTTG
ncbi:hypothetical protein [Streptomyces sp. NPDC012888]|uniref:hypothetical protein n=1 Tax=Streptomyces sp. NPDC012888 TaxID=3364855 RepID=UPI0036816EA9